LAGTVIRSRGVRFNSSILLVIVVWYGLFSGSDKFCKTFDVTGNKGQTKQEWGVDPGWTWGQERGLNNNKGRGLTGNFGLQKGELPKLSLYCPLDEADGHPRVREAYRQ